MGWEGKHRGTECQSVVETLLLNSFLFLGSQRLLVKTGQESNIKGTYLATQAYLRLLPKSQRGSVITVGSISSDFLNPGSSSYVLTKIALKRFNEFVSLEIPNVRAVVYHPGTVLTPILDDFPHIKPFALDTRSSLFSMGLKILNFTIVQRSLLVPSRYT